MTLVLGSAIDDWFPLPVERRRPNWKRVLRKDLCPYCGLRRGRNLDHVEALAAGGPKSVVLNCVGSCRTCNKAKGRTSLLHFLLLITPTTSATTGPDAGLDHGSQRPSDKPDQAQFLMRSGRPPVICTRRGGERNGPRSPRRDSAERNGLSPPRIPEPHQRGRERC